MNARLVFRAASYLALASAAAELTAAERSIDRAAMHALASLHDANTQVLDAFPAGPTSSASLTFRRARIYDDDTRIYVVTASGKTEVPRSERIFLRGYSTDRRVRVAMTLNPDGTFADASGSGPEGAFALRPG